MVKKSKYQDSFVNCKVYNPPKKKTCCSKEDIYPEFQDDDVADKPNIGLCVSGGGTRSAAATIGQLRALHLGMDVLEQFRYISCISGSAWAIVAYYYGQIDEEEFLGQVTEPEDISYEQVMEEPEDDRSFIRAICNTNVLQRFLKGVYSFDESAFAKAVGELYLEPFNCGDSDKFFTWKDENLKEILQRNPNLSEHDFYTIRKKSLPYLVSGSMQFSSAQLDPFHRKFLFEITPLYIGNHILLPYGETEKEITSKRGGGFVEPLGFNTTISDADQVSPKSSKTEIEMQDINANGDSSNSALDAATESVEKGKKSDLCIKTVRVQISGKPFTLCDMIGATSAAPASELFKLRANRHGNGFPFFNYWSPSMSHTRGVETERLEYGDGGVVDNLGLISLLRRKVTSIIIFLNTNRRLYVEYDFMDKGKTHFRSQISQDLVVYFGREKYQKIVQQNTLAGVEQKLDARITSERRSNLYPVKLMSYISEVDFIKNHVLDDEDGTKYEALVSSLIEKRMNGEVASHRDTYNVLDNSYQGVSGGWKVDILWVYNERVKNWEDRIPQQERDLFNFSEQKSLFVRFPCFHTSFENKRNLIGLRSGQANMLAHLSCSSVLSCEKDIREMLNNEVEKLKKKKKLPPPPQISRSKKEKKTKHVHNDSFHDSEFEKHEKKKKRFEEVAKQLLAHFKSMQDSGYCLKSPDGDTPRNSVFNNFAGTHEGENRNGNVSCSTATTTDSDHKHNTMQSSTASPHEIEGLDPSTYSPTEGNRDIHRTCSQAATSDLKKVDFSTKYVKCRVIKYIFSSFREESTLKKAVVELQYKDEKPKKYIFKTSRTVVITACVMDIFQKLNDHWKENDVPAHVAMYDVHCFYTDDLQPYGFIELVRDFQESTVTVLDEANCDYRSVAGHSAAALLLGLHGYRPHSYCVSDGKMISLHVKHAFGLNVTRLDILKEMFFVPQYMFPDGKYSSNKWFNHSCKLAYNVLPPLRVITECIRLRIHDEEIRDSMIGYVTKRYQDYRGNHLIETISKAIVVKLSQIARALKLKKEDFDQLPVQTPHAFIACFNIFGVGVDGFRRLTNSKSGWTMAAACRHEESQCAYLASRKSGALYRFNLRDGTSKLVHHALKWSESIAMGYNYSQHYLYILRNGKKHHDLCKVHTIDGTINSLSKGFEETFSQVLRGGMLPDSTDMYLVLKDESIHCFDTQTSKMRCVLPAGALQGYSAHFVPCGRVFMAFGLSGVCRFDPATAQLSHISHKVWNSVSVGQFGTPKMECFLMVNANGHLLLWDARTDYDRIISLWNENWADSCTVF